MDSNKIDSKHSIDRFLSSMVAASTVTCFLHLSLSVFYLTIQVPELVFYNICGLFLFFWLRILFKKKWVKIPFVLGSLDVITGIIMADYFIGWASNFNIYLIILPVSILIYTGWKIWELSLYLILIFGIYLSLYLLLLDFPGVYTIDSLLLRYLSLANSIATVAFLIVILRFFNSSILNMQKSLESKNKQLKHKTTELDSSLKKEKHAGEMKSHFVSVTSHQFRTPLAIIQSNAQLINMILAKSDLPLKDKIEPSTLRINKEIKRMTELMDDVLLQGKITSGNVDIEPTEVDIHVLIKKIADQYNELQKDNRKLSVTVSGNNIKLNLDVNMIQHAFSNLISNAFKYSEKKNPEVIIEFAEKVAVIMVQDYGIGIPKTEIKNLFQPFYRALNVQAMQGTGLGLSIAKDYVELNGGTIEVESEVNVGTQFMITLPM
jgi:signal transduction histidine kinase